MHGRRSLSLDLHPPDPDLEATLRAARASLRTPQASEPNPTCTMGDEIRNPALGNNGGAAQPNDPQQPQPPRLLRDHFMPNTFCAPSCIHIPNIEELIYEIKQSTINMLPTFHGFERENPYDHITEFLHICNTIRIKDFPQDSLRLFLFSYSLKDKAKHWFTVLELPQPITTWDELQRLFLARYYSIGKTSLMRHQITNFKQKEGEPFYESWERLKELLRLCPHHDIPRWQIVQSFLKGLGERDRQLIHSSCGGSVLRKSDEEIWNLFEMMSEDSFHMESMGLTERDQPSPSSSTSSSTSKKGGMYEVEHFTVVEQKVEALSKKLDQLLALQEKPTASVNLVSAPCYICTDPFHDVLSCPMAGQFPDLVHELVNQAQGYVASQNSGFLHARWLWLLVTNHSLTLSGKLCVFT